MPKGTPRKSGYGNTRTVYTKESVDPYTHAYTSGVRSREYTMNGGKQGPQVGDRFTTDNEITARVGKENATNYKPKKK